MCLIISVGVRTSEYGVVLSTNIFAILTTNKIFLLLSSVEYLKLKKDFIKIVSRALSLEAITGNEFTRLDLKPNRRLITKQCTDKLKKK